MITTEKNTGNSWTFYTTLLKQKHEKRINSGPAQKKITCWFDTHRGRIRVPQCVSIQSTRMRDVCVLIRHACVLIRHACVLIESTLTVAHESYRGACRINTWFFTVCTVMVLNMFFFLESKMFFIWKKCSFFRNKSWFVLEKVTFLTLFWY
jgi:hypothetical protein